MEVKILNKFGELCPHTENTPALFRPKGATFNLRSVVTAYLFENTTVLLDVSYSLLQIKEESKVLYSLASRNF